MRKREQDSGETQEQDRSNRSPRLLFPFLMEYLFEMTLSDADSLKPNGERMIMNVGLSTACLYPELLENELEALGARGVERVEIFINSHCELEAPFVRQLKAIDDRYGVKVVSIHPFTCGIEPMMFFTPYERRFIDILDYYKRYFEAANILGAEYFVFHGNKEQNPFPNKDYFERFAGLFRLGKSFGVTVVQENVARCVSGKLSFLTEMSEYLGDEVAFLLDNKQALRCGADAFEYLAKLRGKIEHIHFSDSCIQSDCVPYGQGDFDCKRFFDTLKKDGYEGDLILELYNEGYGSVDDLVENYRKLKKDALN